MAALAYDRRDIDHLDSVKSAVAQIAGTVNRGRPMKLTIDNLVKDFGGMAALHGVSLEIAAGELLALLGPSGSGKTTLLRLIAGLEFPTSGRILFGQEDASAKTVQERNVGFVFQNYALFRHMTVFENIAFGLRVRPHGTRPAEKAIRERVTMLLELVQLAGLEKRFPAQLSGGQRQRVALARALAIEPRLLLLDEPFGALDAKVRKELRRWLRELHDYTGHTTVFVTHDQEEALELADRVVVMSQGKIEQVGSADDIYDRPATPFVFDFIGDSSSLPVTVAGGRVAFDGQALRLEAGNCPEGPATMFFRPNHAKLAETTEAAIAGTIIGSRRHGDTRRVELEAGAARHRIEIDVPASAEVVRGGQLAIRPTRWLVYPGVK